jgi:hypothetical protein
MIPDSFSVIGFRAAGQGAWLGSGISTRNRSFVHCAEVKSKGRGPFAAEFQPSGVIEKQLVQRLSHRLRQLYKMRGEPWILHGAPKAESRGFTSLHPLPTREPRATVCRRLEVEAESSLKDACA